MGHGGGRHDAHTSRFLRTGRRQTVVTLRVCCSSPCPGWQPGRPLTFIRNYGVLRRSSTYSASCCPSSSSSSSFSSSSPSSSSSSSASASASSSSSSSSLLSLSLSSSSSSSHSSVRLLLSASSFFLSHPWQTRVPQDPDFGAAGRRRGAARPPAPCLHARREVTRRGQRPLSLSPPFERYKCQGSSAVP